MEGSYFSLLWEGEESYREWCKDMRTRDKGYIADLNLKFVYEEVFRAGRFWERYGFEEIFLYPCARTSTVAFRQKIMEQLHRDSFLQEAALEFVSCISALQKRLERLRGKMGSNLSRGDGVSVGGNSAMEGASGEKVYYMGKVHFIEQDPSMDRIKKMISALQIRHDFLVELENIHEKVSGCVSKETPLTEAVKRLSGFISDSKVLSEKEELSAFLAALGQATPCSLILNKNRNQDCQNIVIEPERIQGCGLTEKLMKCAEPFLGKYDFKIGVYQNTDISHLDKRLQEHICRQQPRLFDELGNLYGKYGNYNISQFVQAAKELVFYLSCIRFVQDYEKAGFFFSMPECMEQQVSKVQDAYDMTLGINLYQNQKGCKVVSNDYCFDEKKRIFVLTGANQGGKTTFIRSVGLVQCMAQIGMFVPCRKASLGIVKQIHTHFSREDEKGASVGRFEQELQRVHEVLKNLQDGDMVLLNETFTSTQRSTAVVLLKRFLEELARRHCWGGLVTHFYEVCDGLEGEGFYSLVTEVEGDGDCTERTYRIREGESFRYSFAKDIAVKCGVTYEDLAGVIG